MHTSQQAGEVLQKIGDLSYLVLDPKSSIQGLTKSTLIELGVKQENIHLAKTCAESIKILRKEKTPVLICFLEEDEREVFKVIDSQKILMPKALERIFIAFSNNRSLVSFAHALEGDVDDFMVEPFTEEKLITKIKKSVKNKVFPTPFNKVAAEIELAFKNKQFDQARTLISRALKLHPRPSQAYLFSAKILEAEGNIDEAITEILKGLKFNKSHYKSLLKLHDLYFKNEDYDKALKVLKKLSENFPLSQSRTLEVFRQAILNEEFESLKRYGRVLFENQPFLPLLRVGTAGLIVCALKHLMTKEEVKALNILKEVHKNSQNDPFILKNIFKAMDRYGLHSESEHIYKSFKIADRGSNDYKTCSYIRELNSSKPIGSLIDEAPKRLEEIHFDEDAFSKLLKRASKEADELKLEELKEFSFNFNLQVQM